MPESETADAAGGIISQIAAAAGIPPVIVELALVVSILVAIIIAIALILAVFRIRKELISLNVKMIYIGRLIERALSRQAVPPEAAPKPPKKEAEDTDAEPSETEEKWKL